MEKKRSKSKRIISLILSLVMVLSSTPIGQRQFVFAAGEDDSAKYIYEYDGEKGSSAPSGFNIETSTSTTKKTNALKFGSKGSYIEICDGAGINKGTAVFESCPAF